MKTLTTSLLTGMLAISGHVWAEPPNPDNGKKLHDANCSGCHINMVGGDGSMLYTRPKRRVTSKAKLESQVRRCESNLALKWFDSDILDVASHLNKQYYKLPK